MGSPAPNVTVYTMRLAELWAAYNDPDGIAHPARVRRIVRTYAPAPDMLARLLSVRGIALPAPPNLEK